MFLCLRPLQNSSCYLVAFLAILCLSSQAVIHSVTAAFLFRKCAHRLGCSWPSCSAYRVLLSAIVGSSQLVTTSDRRQVRGRSYPWGVIEVDNEDHCDFVKLRQMLIRTYMEELREHTNSHLYETYRSEKLLGMGVARDSSVFKEIKCTSCRRKRGALN